VSEGGSIRRCGDVEMRKDRSNMSMLVLMVSVASLGAFGCDSDSGAVNPEMQEQAVLAAMEEAIQDEYKAELIYEKVLTDFGPVRPFVNIINAEVRHSESLAQLFQTRGLVVPASKWSPEEIPGFSSLSEACRAGVLAEIENAEIYGKYFDLELPADVRRVFENNHRASLENHLRAFQRCS
jgi:hypothetical protein